MNIYDFPGCCGFKIIHGFGDVKDETQAKKLVKQVQEYIKRLDRTSMFLIALGHPDPQNGKCPYGMKVHQFGLKNELEKAGFVKVLGEFQNPNMSLMSRVSLWAYPMVNRLVEPVEDGFKRIEENIYDLYEFEEMHSP